MNEIQTRLLNSLAIFLSAVLIGGFTSLSVNAQYGNLLSKAAAGALVMGEPQLCRDEMKALIAADEKNIAARLESARCTFVAAVSRASVERRTKELIATGKSPGDAKKEVEMLIQLALTDALNTINPAIAINSKYSPAYNLRGAVYKAQGKNKEARADFDFAVELDSRNFRAYANRGIFKEESNDAAGAIADYEKAAAFGLNDPVINQRLLGLKQKMNQAQNGATVGGTTGNAVKANAEPESELDKVMREEGIVISAEEKAKNKVTAAEMEGFLKPDNLKKVDDALKNINATPAAQSKMTELFFRKQDISKKFGEFETAYAKTSGDSQKLDMINRIKGEYQTALNEAETAERQTSNFSAEQKSQIAAYKAYYSKALNLLGGMTAGKQPASAKTGEFSQSDVDQVNKQNPGVGAATAKLDTQITAAPNDDNLYAQRGMTYLRLRKYGEALADAEKALQLNPQNTNALILRGLLKGNKRDYDGAVTDFSQVIRIAPDRASAAYYRRGEMYEKKGAYEKSLADYNKAAELDPKAADAVTKARARLEAAMKEDAQSRTDFAKMIEGVNQMSPYDKFLTALSGDYLQLSQQSLYLTADVLYKTETPDEIKSRKEKELSIARQKRDLTVRALAELPKFNDPQWTSRDKAEFEKQLAKDNKEIEKLTGELKKIR